MNEPNRAYDADLDALFARARRQRPDTSAAEFAFETRLMARLHAPRDSGSTWAMVSWRLIPFFGACVVALTIWQAQVASDTTDAATVARLNNPVVADLWGN
jgi:hypothetical protein